MPSDFLEKTLEDIIFDNRAVIHKKGLIPFKKTAFRQFVLPSGKKLDIVAYEIKEGHICIDLYELKKDAINNAAIIQAFNYFAELSSIISGHFRSFDIHIIMIGRRYVSLEICENMKLPISIFTYDYTMDGIDFMCMQSRKWCHAPNEAFSNALWAFGSGVLSYPNGQPDIVNMQSIYRDHIAGTDNERWTQSIKEKYIHTPIVVEKEVVVYRNPPTVETVRFPQCLVKQPDWSPGFAASIPWDEYADYFDMEEDLSDYEPEIDEEDHEYELSEIVACGFDLLPFYQIKDPLYECQPSVTSCLNDYDDTNPIPS